MAGISAISSSIKNDSTSQAAKNQEVRRRKVGGEFQSKIIEESKKAAEEGKKAEAKPVEPKAPQETSEPASSSGTAPSSSTSSSSASVPKPAPKPDPVKEKVTVLVDEYVAKYDASDSPQDTQSAADAEAAKARKKEELVKFYSKNQDRVDRLEKLVNSSA